MIATGTFIFSDISQIVRMFTEQSAAGQSLWGWISITQALILYAVFFRIETPDKKLVFWCTMVNGFVVSLIAVTIVFFRYIKG